MKKVFLLFLTLILMLIPALSSCSSSTTATSTSTPVSTVAPSTMPPTSVSTSSPPVSTSVPPTSAPTSTPSTTATGTITTGGTLTLFCGNVPKDIGYQPTMTLVDQYGAFQAIAERLMNINSKGELVPELATSVDTDPAAKTITWHIRQGVQFQDGTPFNAQAAAWNFNQMKDAGTLQYGDQVTGIEVMDNYTLRFTLKTFSYVYVQSFSFNVYMFSPTAIQQNGKQWAITHAYGTGPFEVKSFDPGTKLVLVKNPNYWRSGLPYLDGIELDYNADSAAHSAAMQSNELDITQSGDQVMQKTLVAKGFKAVPFTPNKTAEFYVPSSDDTSSALSNPLVREACEYAIDRAAMCQGLMQGTAQPMDQMSYQGAIGYDPANSWSYDQAKAEQLLTQAGYPGGKGINISIYVPIPAPLVAESTAVAGYLQQIGITAKVVPLPFATYTTTESQGWKNGFLYCRENSGSIWSTAFLSWLGPLPTYNPLPSLARTDAYNQLANQVLSATDATAINSVVTQLVKMVHDNSMVLPLFTEPSDWITQPYVNTDQAATNNRTFDWATVWMSKQ